MKYPLDRRSFVKSVAALGAGLAASASLPKTARAHQASAQGRTRKVVASDAATVVETSSGQVRGYCCDGVYVFKGLPYGASTSGANRFMPPVKPEPWAGIRNALAYGRICPGLGHPVLDGGNKADKDEDAFLLHRGSAEAVAGEDCLRVNVWTPEINGSHARPVLVYMHGGGFTGGCSQDLLSYEGENIARNQDVVVVNHNHRLNIFGYFNLTQWGGPFADSANVGMLDLVAVLEWVRDNIAAFGGDPNQVMIFGQSGGGGKVAGLMAMPAAKGLFHRAIIESGPYLTFNDPEGSAQLAAGVVTELGLTRDSIEQLHEMPVERIIAAAIAAAAKGPKVPFSPLHRTFAMNGWGPTAEGQTIVSHPFEAPALALSSGIPMITGTNQHEFVNGVDNPKGILMTEEELRSRITEGFGGGAGGIIEAYRAEYPGASPFDLYAQIAIAGVRDAMYEQASRKASAGGAPAYTYMFAWKTPMLDGRPGTFHSCEISFALDNAELCDHYSGMNPEALALAKKVSQAWVAFARTGNPNHPGLPHWPALEPSVRPTMVFDAVPAVRHDIEAEGRRRVAAANRKLS